MKKYLLIALCLITVSGWAQLTGTYLKVPALTTPVGRALPDSTLIFVKQQVAFYMTTHALTATQTVQYAIDAGWYAKEGHQNFVFGTVIATAATASTVTLTTANINNLVALPATATPTTTSGIFWSNDTDKHLYYWNGTEWKQLDN